jgi:hypothetical protein
MSAPHRIDVHQRVQRGREQVARPRAPQAVALSEKEVMVRSSGDAYDILNSIDRNKGQRKFAFV